MFELGIHFNLYCLKKRVSGKCFAEIIDDELASLA